MIFDTDVLIWYLKGHSGARDAPASVSYPDRKISLLTHMELLAGARGGREVREIDRMVRSLFSESLSMDESMAAQALRLMRRFASPHGLRPADALVAASALAEDESLVTANVKRYRFIPGLHLQPFRP